MNDWRHDWKARALIYPCKHACRNAKFVEHWPMAYLRYIRFCGSSTIRRSTSGLSNVQLRPYHIQRVGRSNPRNQAAYGQKGCLHCKSGSESWRRQGTNVRWHPRASGHHPSETIGTPPQTRQVRISGTYCRRSLLRPLLFHSESQSG